ncbi:MAG: aminotransferase [Desulfuromonadales bacterium]|nr:aminotransferase [Desulfuromonadales bacterium]
MKISPNITAVNPPPISEVREWIAAMHFPPERPLLDLCQAVPDYPPAPELIEHMRHVITQPETSRYSPDEGLFEVRQAVCDWYQKRYGAGPSVDQLCLSVGASQAFWLAITVLCQAGDEIILPAPHYFDHPMALQAYGVKCCWVPFREETAGVPTLQELEQRITARTKAILLVSPNNPTGAVLSADYLHQVFCLAQKHDIALLLDETYNAFLPRTAESHTQTPHQLFAQADWPESFVHIASFGKTFALTGYRAGALVAGREFIQQALKVQDTMTVCQPRITQHAVAFGCNNLDDWVADKNRQMQQRHDLFCELFDDSNNRFQRIASGGFFAWVRHPWNDLDSRAATRRLLEQSGLACLPGAAFGPGLDAYLRLAFGNLPAEKIPLAVERFLAVGG